MQLGVKCRKRFANWLAARIGRYAVCCMNHSYGNENLKYPRMLYGFITKKSTLPYVEMDVTTRCTLNCKECSHLIPMHEQAGAQADYPIEALLLNVDLLFMQKIKQCYMFRLVGGEPFLHKDLHLVVAKLARLKKVKTVGIVTNGTVVPEGLNLAALRHKKIRIFISDYGALSAKKDELMATLDELGISYRVDRYGHGWHKTDGMKHRGCTKEEMQEAFFRCSDISCKSLHDGKLWLCPNSLHANLLGISKDADPEFIDLRTCQGDDFWRRLVALYDSPDGFESCYRCYAGVKTDASLVPCAEQASRNQ